MALKAVLSQEEFQDLDETTAENYEWSEQDRGYVLSHEIVKQHPGWSKVKKTADENRKSVEQLQKERDALKRRLGPLAESEDVDFSNLDEDTANQIAAFLRGEQTSLEGDKESKDGKQKGQNVDVEKVKANAVKPYQRDLEQVTQERDQLKTKLERVVADNALNGAVAEVGVAGPYQRAVKAMFSNMVKVSEDEDGNPTAIVEGEYGEQNVAKYLKEWAQTDEGRAFVAGNNGSGAPGGKADSGKYAQNPFSREHWNVTEQARVAREAPERARRMAAQAGRKAPV